MSRENLGILNAFSASGRMIRESGDAVNVADLVGRINSSMTTFDEVVAAIPNTQIDLKSVYPISILRDRIEATNGGVEQEDGGFTVSVDGESDGEVLFRSVARGRYVAGYDALAGMALSIPDRPTGNQVIEFGYTDFVNGMVVGEDAEGMYTAVYRGGEKTNIRRRGDWDNPAEDDLDPSRLTIYRMAFRWYGRGPMKLAIAGDNGKIDLDNSLMFDEGPITLDPNQPLSVKIKNNGTAEPLSVKVYSRQFFILGDYSPNRRFTSQARLAQAVGTTFVPLIAYRAKGGSYGSITLRLQDVQMLSAAQNIVWEIRVGATLTGDTWVDPSNSDDGNETAIEANVTATAVTGGVKVYQGLGATAQGQTAGASSQELPDIDLPSQPLNVVLCARSTTGTATVDSVFNIAEEW